MDLLPTLMTLLSLMALFFVLVIGLALIAVVVVYFIDKRQKGQAIRHNYPVIGHFRYLFEHLGVFFRQYFFAMDREELPFNRAQRGWVYRAAKDLPTTVAFGSTRDLTPVGSVLFVNCPFPTLGDEALKPSAQVIGTDCREPYSAPSFFNISGMSYGALSAPAVEALSRGAAKAHCWLNTGEGGLSDHHLVGGCDLVFQIGTAKYGVRDSKGNLSDEKLREIAAHKAVRMFEIKLSQGGKPGKGGILPADKVTQEIANIRGIPMGVASISPNRHLNINSNNDLLDMIEHIRELTGKPVGIKAVIGAPGWLDALCEAIQLRGASSAPDFFTVDGAEGGTGAAPMPLIDYMGLPLRESLPIVVDRLRAWGLDERVRVIASGKLVTPSVVAWAIAMGADFVVSARGFMFSLGCIQAMQCHQNTCPTGITTHDPSLQQGLDPMNKSERVLHYVERMYYGVGLIAHACGVTEPHALRRHHARVVMQNGLSTPLDELHPIMDRGCALRAFQDGLDINRHV